MSGGSNSQTDSDSSGDMCMAEPGDSSCDACLKENCCEQYIECVANPGCLCALDCADNGGNLLTCALQCKLNAQALLNTVNGLLGQCGLIDECGVAVCPVFGFIL